MSFQPFKAENRFKRHSERYFPPAARINKAVLLYAIYTILTKIIIYMNFLIIFTKLCRFFIEIRRGM